MQADPIFLLRKFRFVGTSDSLTYDDGQLMHNGETITEAEAVERELGDWAKETVAVFLDRDEAMQWGKENRHNLGRRGERWDVYCVSAVGELAKILRAPFVTIS